MPCPFDAQTVKDCLSRRRIEFRQVRFEWSAFPCESCKDGIANEEAVAEKEGCRIGGELPARHNPREKVAQKYCADCGKPVKPDTTRCRACHNEWRNMAV